MNVKNKIKTIDFRFRPPNLSGALFLSDEMKIPDLRRLICGRTRVLRRPVCRQRWPHRRSTCLAKRPHSLWKVERSRHLLQRHHMGTQSSGRHHSTFLHRRHLLSLNHLGGHVRPPRPHSPRRHRSISSRIAYPTAMNHRMWRWLFWMRMHRC